MEEKELLATLALLKLDGIGPISSKILIDIFGSAVEVFNATPFELSSINGIGQKIISSIKNNSEAFQAAETELTYIQKHNIRVVRLGDQSYPRRLSHCPDAPYVLFVKGNFDFNSHRSVAIVGTRRMTTYGLDLTQRLVESLVPYQVNIISGLALGVDAEAHRSAMRVGLPTLGVLGHGLDRIYPSQNRSLAEQMWKGNGGIASEFFTGTQPDRENFPRRNRIVAGLIDALVVVEAAAEGGALITASIANSYSRDVFAFPGRVGDPFSEGALALIQQNKAALLRDPSDLPAQMGWVLQTSEVADAQRKLFVELSPEENLIRQALLEVSSLHIDEIGYITELPPSKVSFLLLNLEMKGLIRNYPGNRYGWLH